MSDSVANFETQKRTTEAAKRVFNTLVDNINVSNHIEVSQSDSGYEMDFLLDENYVLECKKMRLIEDGDDAVLAFLRPAPPKMSLRQSRIRRKLFPDYKSLEPIEIEFESLQREVI